MPDFILNKLVRDGMPGLMKAAGQTPISHVLQGQALQKAMLVKIKEEVGEAIGEIDSDEKFVSELADIQELIDSLLLVRGIDPATIKTLQKSINDKKGSFKDGIYLEKVFVDEASEWTRYYRTDPARFTESGVEHADDDIPELELGTYEHYKGKRYEVIGLAHHTETSERFVVYKPLYDHGGQPDTWIRPYEMFIENVVIDGSEIPRFKKVTDNE